MSLSDKFCVDRHKKDFYNLVKYKLDITFANEQEIIELIDAKTFNDVIEFGKSLNKLLVVTRSDKGSFAISGTEIVECKAQKDLKIIDVTGAGDLFAAGYYMDMLTDYQVKKAYKKETIWLLK
jgi:fructokinase